MIVRQADDQVRRSRFLPAAGCFDFADSPAITASLEATKVLFDGPDCWILHDGDPLGCITCFGKWLFGDDLSEAVETQPSTQLSALDAAVLRSALYSLSGLADAASGSRYTALRVCLDRGTISRHAYQIHPNCSDQHAAPGQGATQLELPGAIDLHQITGRREVALGDICKSVDCSFFDDRLGLIRASFRPNESEHQSITLATIYPFASPSASEYGYGRTGQPRHDVGAAFLEALERFSSVAPSGDTEIVRGSYSDLQARAFDPRRLIPHEPVAFESPSSLIRFDPDHPYDWVWGYEVGKNRPILVPAQIAYYSNLRLQDEHRFIYETSSGSSIGSNIGEAIFHGILEAIERDAFLVNWFGHRTPAGIDLSSVEDTALLNLTNRLTSCGCSLEVEDISLGKCVHVFLAKVVNQRNPAQRSLYVAAGAHVDPIAALWAAINEVVTMVRRSTPEEFSRESTRAQYLLSEPSAVMNLEDHDTLCWSPDSIERLQINQAATMKPWAEYRHRKTTADPGDTTLHDLIQHSGLPLDDIIIVKFESRLLQKAGLCAAKVICPKLIPMTFGHNNRRIDWKRVEAFSDHPAELLQSAAFMRPHIFP